MRLLGPTLILLLGFACWSGGQAPSTPGGDNSALQAELETLRQEVLDLQDRVTEIEAANHLRIEDIPAEFDAYITHRELDEALGERVHADELDELLVELALRADLDDAIAEVPTKAELDEALSDVARKRDLAALSASTADPKEIERRLDSYVTRDDLDQRLDGLATRTWVEEQMLLRFDLWLWNQGIAGNVPGRRPATPARP